MIDWDRKKTGNILARPDATSIKCTVIVVYVCVRSHNSLILTHTHTHSLNECHILYECTHQCTYTHRFLLLLHPKSLSSQTQRKTGRIQRQVDRLKREYINITVFCIDRHTRCWIKHTNTSFRRITRTGAQVVSNMTTFLHFTPSCITPSICPSLFSLISSVCETTIDLFTKPYSLKCTIIKWV